MLVSCVPTQHHDFAAKIFHNRPYSPQCRLYVSPNKKNNVAPNLRITLILNLLRSDDWQHALEQSKQFVGESATSAQAHGVYALVLLRAGNFITASDEAQKALALDAQDYWALATSGWIQYLNNHTIAARKTLCRATMIRPHEPDAWRLLLLTYDELQRPRQIIDSFLKLAPKGYPYEGFANHIKDMMPFWTEFQKDTPFQRTEAGGANIAQIVVPFEKDSGFISIAALLGSKKVKLVYDTGAAILALQSSVIEELKLQPIVRTTAHGADGTQEATVCKAQALSLGNCSFHSIPILSTSIPMELHTDGALGNQAFRGYIVDIDMQAQTLTTSTSYSLVHGSNHCEIPFKYINGLIFLSCEIEGQSCWAMLDTGSQGSYMSEHVAKLLPKQAGVLQKIDIRTVGLGVSKTKPIYTQWEHPVTVNIATITNSFSLNLINAISNTSIDEQFSKSFGFEVSIVLGMPFIEQFSHIIINYRTKSLILVADVDPDKSPKPRPGGTWVYINGHWVWGPFGSTVKSGGDEITIPFPPKPGDNGPGTPPKPSAPKDPTPKVTPSK